MSYRSLLYLQILVWMNLLVGLAYGQVPKISDETLQAVRESTAFGLQLFHQMPSDTNVCFSPFSISSALAMVYAGAKGETQNEIANVLHYPKSFEKVGEVWAGLNRFLTFYPSNASEDIRLKLANALWMQVNLPILPAFKEFIAKYFIGSLRFVDFKDQMETARTALNSWVKQNTFGKITDILPPHLLNSSTRMVLTSGIYFKGKWKNQFDKRVTRQQPFILADGTLQTVLSMVQSATFPYLDTAEVTLLAMPYVLSRKDGPEFLTLLVLPHQKNGLRDIENEISVEKISQWITNLTDTRVIVTIPKFKIVQSTSLNEILSKLGIGSSFSDEADFSGISDVKNIQLNGVLHKVFFSVDESGSEAAPSTAVSLYRTAEDDSKPWETFQANHPFLYIVFEKTTGIIVFIGHVTDPNKL